MGGAVERGVRAGASPSAGCCCLEREQSMQGCLPLVCGGRGAWRGAGMPWALEEGHCHQRLQCK